MVRFGLALGLVLALSLAVVKAASHPESETLPPRVPEAHDAEGVIVFFPRADCPSDFSEYTSARGRVIVALPAGGTPGEMVGDPLTDLSGRITTEVVSHTHLVNPPSTTTDVDSHNHLVNLAANEQAGGNANGAQGNSGRNNETSTSTESHTHEFSFPSITSSETGEPDGVDVSTPYVQLLACESNGPLNAFPTGAVAFVSSTSCPSGWVELNDARGRVVVGTDNAAIIRETVGDPLADRGLRTITEVPTHSHSFDPPPITSSNNGAHNHSINTQNAETEGGNEERLEQTTQASNTATTSDASHSHNVDVNATTSSAVGASEIDVTMPYIQLLLCQRGS